DACEIYSDVDGIFTADPRIVPNAHQISQISYEEALDMAANGAKILHLRCVEYARRYNMPLHVRSSFSERQGTWVINAADIDASDTSAEGESSVEHAIITGVAHDRDRKSTRLNSSHVSISYAVFCLEKK